MGPSAVRCAGLEYKLEQLGHTVEDGGNVPVAMPEQKNPGKPEAKYLKEIASTCQKHADLVVSGEEPLANSTSVVLNALRRAKAAAV